MESQLTRAMLAALAGDLNSYLRLERVDFGFLPLTQPARCFAILSPPVPWTHPKASMDQKAAAQTPSNFTA